MAEEGEQPGRDRRVAGAVFYNDRKQEAQRKCAALHMDLLHCMKGNHLFSGRTCNDEQNKYWTCLEEHAGVTRERGFMDAVSDAMQTTNLLYEQKRDAFTNAYKDFVNGGGKS
jgi:hypothetical protein